MTEETLETIILGHIATELKDEIQIGRQVNLARTIMKALRIHDVVGRSEQLKAFNDWFQKNGHLYEWGIDESVIDDYLKTILT